MRVRRDLGDFQTPPGLVAAVLETLGPIGRRWPRVLEPTCGVGRFIDGLLEQSEPPREIQAIEIQQVHCRVAGAMSDLGGDRGARVVIRCANLFDLDLGRDLRWQGSGPLLVIGNPPWVTSSELGRLAGTVVPPKRNVKGLRGIEARTGASNFDAAEAVWLKLIRELAVEEATIALLCKTAVARSVLQFAHRAALPIASASIHRINAGKWFGASVEACLFRATLGEARGYLRVPVFPGLGQPDPDSVMGFARGWLVADGDVHRRCDFADGASPRTWRQGLKHDAASVMELAREHETGRLTNRGGEVVDVEAEFVYPLIKGADLRGPRAGRPGRAVLVTQEKIGDDTTRLIGRAPRLWTYLQAHAARFADRKSSIYRGQPPFALFGVGPYSFAPFKVAVSGLHKAPAFKAFGPVQGRPVMLDDTCYFLPCRSAEEAAVLAALCNDPIALELIRSSSFPDAKRPITKALLQRVDLRAILERGDRPQLLSRAAAVMADELTAQAAESLSDVVERLKREFSPAS